MSELENFEADAELGLYREYRDVVSLFQFVIDERRFYLANDVDVKVRASAAGDVFRGDLTDAWVWDIFSVLPASFAVPGS